MSKKVKLNDIFFFGDEGLDLKKIKASMPVQAGDTLDADDPSCRYELQERINTAVRQVTGKDATDIAFISFYQQYVVYIGLPGASSRSASYNPPPDEEIVLPTEFVKLYDEMMEANLAYHRGSAKDEDRYVDLKGEATRQALKMPNLLVRVLVSSSSATHRRVAAKALGLIVKDTEHIDALVKASRDSDDGVRNNAVAALGRIAESDLSEQIPASVFVEMLNSGTWSDRNKASFVLVGISRTRKPETLEALRLHALVSLKEMAGWELLHAAPALTLIGRMADIPEDRLNALIETKRVAEIINSLPDDSCTDVR